MRISGPTSRCYVPSLTLFSITLAAGCGALAQTITFNVSGTFTNGAVLSGTMTIDNVAGQVTAANLSIGVPISETFNVISVDEVNAFNVWAVKVQLPGTTTPGVLPNFLIDFPTSTLVGYEGGQLCSVSVPCAGVGISSSLQVLPLGTPNIQLQSGTASIQAPPITCFFESSTPIDGGEGVTELVGDVVLACTGGAPTPPGSPIPQSNFTIAVNTNITSRLLSGSSATGGVSESILSIDEPFSLGSQVPSSFTPLAGAPTAQLGCVASNSTNCAILGTGGGFGASGPYNGSAGHYNLFQGTWSAPNRITWTGVPIDPPGVTATRIIRITNVRANARLLGVACTLVPANVLAFISISGSQNIVVNNTLGFVGFTFQDLIRIISPSGDVSAEEGFASAFKPRNFVQYGPSINAGGTGSVTSPVKSASANGLQNVLGYNYVSQSGFVTDAAGLLGDGTGPGSLGLADTGTEIAFQFSGPSSGTITVPDVIYLYPAGTMVTGATGATGATGVAVLAGTGFAPGATTELAVSGGSATATYEVLLADPSVIEFAFLPSPGAGITTNVSLVPTSTADLADPAAPIPRFVGSSVCPTAVPSTSISVTATGLLFSRVTGLFSSTVTVKNISGATITGPLELAIAGLPAGVVPINATASLSLIGPYITLPAASLSPGQPLSVKVEFSTFIPGVTISFTPVVFSGSF